MSDFQKYLDEAIKKVALHIMEDEEEIQEYDVYAEISQQIVRTRLELGITQKELAVKVGLTQANISKIEKGVSHPTIDTLIKLANGLNKRLVVRFDEFQE